MLEIKIGNNVKIGVNAIVTNDITDNCTVFGIIVEIVRRSKLYNEKDSTGKLLC